MTKIKINEKCHWTLQLQSLQYFLSQHKLLIGAASSYYLLSVKLENPEFSIIIISSKNLDNGF